MKKYFLLLLFVFVGTSLYADYLITYRSANIKAEPLSGAAVLENVGEGTMLILLNEGVQTNGYYLVRAPSGTEGWVYRTLVRRYVGSIPGADGTPSSTSDENVEVTAIDVGAGLSCLIKLPGEKYIIYDGGRSSAMTYIREKIPAGSAIEALILSHTDADHWGAAEKIVDEYRVKHVYRTDYRDNKLSQTYNRAVAAIENAPYDIEDYNLGEHGNLQPGQVLYDKNDVKIYALCGFKEPLPEWGLKDSKANNAVSIVVRLEYKGHSIIFAGDAVGRDDCDEDNVCIATEKFMLDNVSAGLLDADVLVAAHHGADNGSCEMFIEKVSPDYVIFSAGHS
ncbi:MAG: MBL fold metallo-hydrolase, partial [Cyclobacteriaceae bacterium]